MSGGASLFQELNDIPRNPKTWRQFGFIMAGVLAIFAGISFWKHGHLTPLGTSLAVIAAIFGIAGAVFPQALNRVHVAWMFLSLCLGWVMSRVILIVIFTFFIIPMHYLGIILGLPFIEMQGRRQKPSHWVSRKPRKINHHETLF